MKIVVGCESTIILWKECNEECGIPYHWTALCPQEINKVLITTCEDCPAFNIEEKLTLEEAVEW